MFLYQSIIYCFLNEQTVFETVSLCYLKKRAVVAQSDDSRIYLGGKLTAASEAYGIYFGFKLYRINDAEIVKVALTAMISTTAKSAAPDLTSVNALI